MRRLLLLFLGVTCCQGEVLQDLAYVKGGHDLQKLDLYQPKRMAKEPIPVVIAIHGGGWSFGDKSNFGFVQPKTLWLNSRGYLVASVNYRLSPAVTHPTHVNDVCKAIAWVHANIAKHGGDPDNLILLGHSAGAHLAALAAVDEAKLKEAGVDPKAIKGVVCLDGAAYDVQKQIAETLGIRRDNMYSKAFTHDLKTQRDASPIFKVAEFKRVPPPFLILHVADRDSSRLQSEALAKAVRNAGGKAEVLAVKDKSHATINRHLGKLGDATTLAVDGFLKGLP